MTENNKFITSTDKINEALGITEGGTVDDVLAEFDKDLESIEAEMKLTVDKVDNELVKSDDIHTLTASLGELSDLIRTSKGMLGNICDYVNRSEIMDPDVIGAGADLIKASNELLREYLEIYKDKIRHFNAIELEMIKNQNKKDLELYKYELKNGKIGDNNGVVDMVEYTQETIVKAMNDIK